MNLKIHSLVFGFMALLPLLWAQDIENDIVPPELSLTPPKVGGYDISSGTISRNVTDLEIPNINSEIPLAVTRRLVKSTGLRFNPNAVPLSGQEGDVSGIFAWSWGVKSLLTI
jgi:hypothetical protein